MKELFVFQLVFYLVLLPVLYITQRFWFLKVWQGIQRVGSPWQRIVLRTVCCAAAAVLLLVAIDSSKRIIPRGPAGTLVLAGGMIWFGISMLGLLTIQLDRIFSRYLTKYLTLSHPPQIQNPQRRLLLQTAIKVGASLPFVAAAYGAERERLAYRIARLEIPVPGLHAGLKVVHLSDIHAGDFMPVSEVRRIVEMANQLGGDIAIVTGDLITDVGDPLIECIEELSRLRAPLGIWGCNGNHEIYADAEEASQRLFRQHGMCLLRQESREISWRGKALNLIGVDYQIQGKSKVSEMLPGMEMLVRPDVPNVLLSHNPNSFYRAADCGIEVMLAGHTHGGQVEVEILHRDLNPAAFFTRFIGGPYYLPRRQSPGDVSRSGNYSSLYVNRGLGTVKLPIRWGVPPEIALLTLMPA